MVSMKNLLYLRKLLGKELLTQEMLKNIDICKERAHCTYTLAIEVDEVGLLKPTEEPITPFAHVTPTTFATTIDLRLLL